MPQLLQFRIPHRVGAKYFTFGILLLNDTDGSVVDGFKIQCLGNPEHITQEILKEWLLGRGLELTWETLLKTLRDSYLPALADEVHQKLLLNPPPHS